MGRHPVRAAILGVHAAFVLAPLLALGVPWSLPLTGDVSGLDGFESLPAALRYLIAFGSAWLNVVLHAVVFVVVGRRGVARSQAAQASSA